ncbi:hypothetical protein HDV03_000296 [Kappamyces sp. JEL0829]|nr:hypothetical protein HDV03_000296 [Kappamyces sp. JEL0829]
MSNTPSISFDDFMAMDREMQAAANTGPQTQKTKKLCRQFQEGTCHFGASCKFRHESSPAHISQSLAKLRADLEPSNDSDPPEEASTDKTELLQSRQTPQREPRKSGRLSSALKDDWRESENASRGRATPQSAKNTPKKNVYADHYNAEKIQAGLQDGSLLQGIMRISKKNRQDAYVRFEGRDDVFIPGTKNQNRALDGDCVAIRILEGKELEKETRMELEKKKTRSVQNQERQARVNLFEEKEEEFDFQDSRIYATVVGIVESNVRDQHHVGTLQLDKPGTPLEVQSAEVGRFVWFRPNDKRVPYLLIPSQIIPSEVLKQKADFCSNLYTAKITEWNETSVYPKGMFTGHLGQMGELPTESEALLVSAGIYWEDFSDAVLASLVPTPWSIPASEFEKRADLRGERIFSIDPPTARDLDDAVSIKRLHDGTYELGVHIADVSYFVTPNTELDKEAYNRATSVYLVQKVVPMLPRLLCEELCSLNPGVDRLAFSVFWKIDKDANMIGEPWFRRSVINSCAKLWYDHAQAVIDEQDWHSVSPVQLAGGWTDEQVQDDIRLLHQLSLILRRRRYESGALTLNSIKLWFKLDDVGNPINSGIYEQKDANRLIEEFMLLANMAVAKRISSEYPDAALLRRHPPPLNKALDETIDMLRKEGIVLDPSSAGSLQTSLEAIEDPRKKMLTRLLMIKSMKRAEYFCTGSVDLSTFSHYALSVPLYTHFTSPIRRYCDLVVHRLLQACLQEESAPFSTALLNSTAQQCNFRKFASKDAQDASQDLFLCAFLWKIQNESSAGGVVADAFVNGVGSRAFDVIVPQFGIETRVWLEDSMDLGHIAGVEPDVENNKLKVHWMKRQEEEVNLGQEYKAKSGKPKSTAGTDAEATTGLDPSKYFTQVIGMFDQVCVRIVVDMKKSPPSYKLFAVKPAAED